MSQGIDRRIDGATEAAIDIAVPQRIGDTADLRWLYTEGEAGREHLRALPARTNRFLIDYLGADHPERIPWICTQRKAICRAMLDPLLVEGRLRRSSVGYWRVTVVGKADGDEHEYVVVALSLANLPGMPDADIHDRLCAQYAELAPLQLQRELTAAIAQLWKLEAVDPASERAQRLREAAQTEAHR